MQRVGAPQNNQQIEHSTLPAGPNLHAERSPLLLRNKRRCADVAIPVAAAHVDLLRRRHLEKTPRLAKRALRPRGVGCRFAARRRLRPLCPPPRVLFPQREHATKLSCFDATTPRTFH
ncbi:unnamed protein product, partial [Iphiclides podalirius]